MNLSRSGSDLESVYVLASSNIEGHSEKAAEPVEISARCKASGFKLISLKMSAGTKEVRFSPDDLKPEGKGMFSISENSLKRYIPDIFGDEVEVESFAFHTYKFKFAAERFKKVPVVAVQYITYKDQHMPTSPIRFSPDSIAVYGEPHRLESIDRILTKPLTLKDIHATAHGMTDVEIPNGVRLSDTEVSYELEVSRYIEIREKAKVKAINVPAGMNLEIFPSSVEVTYRCSFPIVADPRETASCIIDYRDFSESLTGKCMIRIENNAEGIIAVKTFPEACDCVETKKL